MSSHGHKHPDNAIAALLVVVLEAIAEVFLICFVGYILARRGILTANVRKSLNRLNVAVLTPSLLFSKVAFSLSPNKLTELWIVPVGFVLVTGTSLLVAYVVGKIFRLKRSNLFFTMAVASSPNSNSLPIAFMQSLVVSIDELKWGKDDTKDEMLGRALSYLVVFSTLGIIYRWSLAVKLLSGADEPTKPILPETRDQQVASPPAIDREEQPFIAPATADGSTGSNASSPTLSQKKRRKRGEVFNSFPNTPDWRTPAHSSRGSDDDSSEEDELSKSQGAIRIESSSEDEEWGPARGRPGKPVASKLQRQVKKGWASTSAFLLKWVWRPTRRVLGTIKSFMTVPLYAAFLSLIVCCIPPLQHFLGDLVPLRGALKQAGNCSIPLTLLVLGGFMHEEAPAKESSQRARSKSPGRKKSDHRPVFARGTSLRRSTKPAKKGETLTVAIGIASRMLITPAVLLPLLYLYSLNKTSVADDPVFVVAACLILGSPPALTLAQITESASGDTFERLISKTMLISYGVLTAPTTVILVLLGLVMDRSDRP